MNSDNKIAMSKMWGIVAIVGIAAAAIAFVVGSQLFPANHKPVRAEGLMHVKILEECHNVEGKKWYLIQAGDGQRGFIHFYRGKIGDEFYMWPEDIGGFQTGPIPPDEKSLIDKPQIDLGVTDEQVGEKQG